ARTGAEVRRAFRRRRPPADARRLRRRPRRQQFPAAAAHAHRPRWCRGFQPAPGLGLPPAGQCRPRPRCLYRTAAAWPDAGHRAAGADARRRARVVGGVVPADRRARGVSVAAERPPARPRAARRLPRSSPPAGGRAPAPGRRATRRAAGRSAGTGALTPPAGQLFPTMAAPLHLDSLDTTVDRLLAHAGPHLVLAAPLGLGKPHRLLNAITRRIAAEPERSLQLLTALSLTPPSAGSGLQARFLRPFLE